MSKNPKIIKVIFVHFLNGRKNMFFGSITAIFEHYTKEDLGCTEETLRHNLTSDGSSFLSKKAFIYRSHLIQKRHQTNDV